MCLLWKSFSPEWVVVVFNGQGTIVGLLESLVSHVLFWHSEAFAGRVVEKRNLQVRCIIKDDGDDGALNENSQHLLGEASGIASTKPGDLFLLGFLSPEVIFLGNLFIQKVISFEYETYNQILLISDKA